MQTIPPRSLESIINRIQEGHKAQTRPDKQTPISHRPLNPAQCMSTAPQKSATNQGSARHHYLEENKLLLPCGETTYRARKYAPPVNKASQMMRVRQQLVPRQPLLRLFINPTLLMFVCLIISKKK